MQDCFSTTHFNLVCVTIAHPNIYDHIPGSSARHFGVFLVLFRLICHWGVLVLFFVFSLDVCVVWRIASWQTCRQKPNVKTQTKQQNSPIRIWKLPLWSDQAATHCWNPQVLLQAVECLRHGMSVVGCCWVEGMQGHHGDLHSKGQTSKKRALLRKHLQML